MKFNKMQLDTIALASIGFVARISLTKYFGDVLQNRVEINTPINNWKKSYEAVHLWNLGLDPYSADIFHEYPISLVFYDFISTFLNTRFLFALIDVITSVLLQQYVHNLLSIDGNHDQASRERKSRYVLLSYLFSPMSLLSCSGLSTTVFTNFLIALTLHVTSLRISSRYVICVLAAILSCNNLHFSTLVLPILLSFEYLSLEPREAPNYYKNESFHKAITESIVSWISSVLALLLISYFIMGNSWNYLQSTYLFILKVQDYTPNIGMFWYFYTEVFENFLDFFTWVFQINSFIHVIPLCLYLRKDPIFAVYFNLLTSVIFQPYPSLGHLALLFSLTFQWCDLFQYLKRGLIVTSACMVCMTLWPIFWHQWIEMGTGNANFYFGSTIAFIAAVMLFMVDIIQAYRQSKLKKENVPEN